MRRFFSCSRSFFDVMCSVRICCTTDFLLCCTTEVYNTAVLIQQIIGWQGGRPHECENCPSASGSPLNFGSLSASVRGKNPPCRPIQQIQTLQCSGSIFTFAKRCKFRLVPTFFCCIFMKFLHISNFDHRLVS